MIATVLFTSISATDMTICYTVTIGSFGIDQGFMQWRQLSIHKILFYSIKWFEEMNGLLAGTMCFITKSH
jgi:hypothetical protein